LGEMDRVTRRVIAELRALPSVAGAGATLGRAVSADRIVDASSGQILVTIKPGADYDRATSAIRATVEDTPGIRASVSAYENDVVVWGAPSVRTSAATVRNLLIDTSGGGHVRLGDIATVGVQAEPTDIQHQALSRYLDVTAPTTGTDAGDAAAVLRRGLGHLP